MSNTSLKHKIISLKIDPQKRRSFLGMTRRIYKPGVYDAIRLGVIRAAGIDLGKQAEINW